MKTYDVAVIGAGIVGLSIALAAAKRGKKVIVFERYPKAQGASVRNFGLIWPIGQRPGNELERALRSREIWLDLKDKANIWVQENGSLQLAYHDDELAVLNEFVETTHGAGYKYKLINPKEINQYSKVVVKDGLKGALYSETELTVTSRDAIRAIPKYLQERYDVEFVFNTAITRVEMPSVFSFDEEWIAEEQVFICSGADFETLYPKAFKTGGIKRCKLQMLSTIPQPDEWELGASLCAGLTLTHYAAFEHCKSLQEVSDRYYKENPDYKKWGIHVLLSQHIGGELIIGDSHEYGLELNPFDKEFINKLILEYLKSFAHFPNWVIKERWHGIYPKLPNGQTHLIQTVEEGVTIINGLGGAGMTLSFGLAEEIVKNLE